MRICCSKDEWKILCSDTSARALTWKTGGSADGQKEGQAQEALTLLTLSASCFRRLVCGEVDAFESHEQRVEGRAFSYG